MNLYGPLASELSTVIQDLPYRWYYVRPRFLGIPREPAVVRILVLIISSVAFISIIRHNWADFEERAYWQEC